MEHRSFKFQLLEAGLIKSSGKLIQRIFSTAAKLSLSPKKFNFNTKKNVNKHPKRWFDPDCIDLSNKVRTYAERKHNTPWDNNLKELHRNLFKDYKTSVDQRTR